MFNVLLSLNQFLLFGQTPSQFATNALLFFAILFVLVIIHELGHYLAAKLIGVKVEEFGFGLPPKIWEFRTKHTENTWSINLLPIGGFVRLAGEDAEADEIATVLKEKKKPAAVARYFWARNPLERSFILLAGVTMNFLLAVTITSYLITAYGIEEPTQRVKVTQVQENSPAQAAGVQAGDVISHILVTENGRETSFPTRHPDELKLTATDLLGKTVTLVIARNGEALQLPITLRSQVTPEQGAIGIGIDFDTRSYKVPWYQAPIAATKLNITRGKDMLIALGSLPSRIIQGQNVRNEVAGPIGIAQVTTQAAQLGTEALLNVVSILSLSLAVLNTLPIPALDGGRFLFVLIEAITRKRVKADIERYTHSVGMIILLGFILLVTLNDISRFFGL